MEGMSSPVRSLSLPSPNPLNIEEVKGPPDWGRVAGSAVRGQGSGVVGQGSPGVLLPGTFM